MQCSIVVLTVISLKKPHSSPLSISVAFDFQEKNTAELIIYNQRSKILMFSKGKVF